MDCTEKFPSIRWTLSIEIFSEDIFMYPCDATYTKIIKLPVSKNQNDFLVDW